ncbi:hypothetical protein SPRG_02790 [Saprolegnia parasitica CBS 223.65]|uniref:DUF4246 domain-containing protein n=1 Tax=Saprolegnia parasitica (strain CBS 223.65) TaxID=695850 RepID=A0A067D0M5_SAPPC|nr:hypothetical protein SPRG_02790 [Saprolegnia parasitica CBS 223.65]KDO32311.1 hypothetical protein SPRG_02790 [Saprolegnia parasitica CBS 223.65]|eukprot:XP_012196767.1 hypothetical protein SPRG_02790 [Saprolegnia parasitica CBS 223.65]
MRFPETSLLWEGWRTKSIAYSALELQYMAALCSVLDAPDWRSTSSRRLASPLLCQEVDHIRDSNPHDWTPNTARGVYHADFGNDDETCAALRTHLASLAGPWSGPLHTIVEPMRCGSIEGRTRVESLHAPPTPWATEWRRGTGAINEAVRLSALVFYDLVNVEARLELRETFERANTHPSPDDEATEVFGREISEKRTQETGFLTAHIGRVVLIHTNVAYRVTLRRVDATRGGHCNVLAWHLVDAHNGGLLSTAEVYPQQRAWFLEAIQGTRLTALPTDLLELVLLCVGAGFEDDATFVDTCRGTRDDIVRRSM